MVPVTHPKNRMIFLIIMPITEIDVILRGFFAVQNT